MEFYDMLTESFRKHPQVIIVSTHIIEGIAKTIQKLIIIDKGCIRFFDTLQAVETKAFSVSGLKKDMDTATANLNVIGQDTVGGLVWLTDGVLAAIICIFTPIAPLRHIGAGFFKVIMFNSNALLHIGSCLLISAVLSLMGVTSFSIN